MRHKGTERKSRPPLPLRMAAVRLGITLIVLASVGLLTHLTGLLPFDSWPFGQSALRTLAEVAVLGCLLAAIGYWDE